MKRVALFLCLVTVAVTGCGGGGDGSVGEDRIGRGVDQPVGDTVTVSFQNGAGGYSGGDDYKTNSSAGANLLEIEITGGTIYAKTYLYFDLSGTGLPADATVTDAEVTLTVYRENGCGQSSDFIELRQLTEAWTGSGDKSYVLPPIAADGILWVDTLPDGSGGDPNVLDTPLPLDVPLDAALVQSWVDTPAANNGIILVPAVDSNGLQLHFFSSQESTVSYRPKLTITYTTDTNQPPTASVSASPTTGNVPLTVDFTGTGTDPDGTISAYRYDFDDGEAAGTASVQHAYDRPGTYFVNFTVADDGGKMDTDIVVITVSDPSVPAQFPSVGFHPEGGEPPASEESVAPGVARPLPSSRRDILVWHDQVYFVYDNPSHEPLAAFTARNMVGTQKITQNLIEVLRAHNPDFRVLQYHLAYGLTRGQDITDKNVWGLEKTRFDAWMSSRGYGSTQEDGLIINSNLSSYMSEDDSPDWGNIYDHSLRATPNFYYTDIGYNPGGGSLWHRYIGDETLRRMQMNDAGYNFDGTFFDSASQPTAFGLVSCPSNWYTDSDAVSVATNTEFAAWWGPRAEAYFNYVRGRYSSGQRYLVIPNCNRMLTGWYDPTYMNYTDGGFAETFSLRSSTETLVQSGSGTWELSIGRTCQYITGPKKVFLSVTGPDVGAIETRKFALASFLLIKNDTSYYSLNNAGSLGPSPTGSSANPRWFPEYEIDIGCYLDDAPDNVDDLRVEGSSAGGLYVRWYSGGLVLVNSSPSTTYSIELDRTYYPVDFSGGGWVGLDGSKPAMSLWTGSAVSGTYDVPPDRGRILRAAPIL